MIAVTENKPICSWLWKIVVKVVIEPFSKPYKWLRQHPGVLWSLFLSVWGVAALGVGLAYATNHCGWLDILLHSMFTAIQMIVANAGIEADTGNSYSYAFQRIGQFGLPFLALLGLVEGAVRLKERQEADTQRGLLASKQGHIVFLGFGYFLRQRAKKYQAKDDVVAVDLQQSLSGESDFTSDILYVSGNAQDKNILSQLNLERAGVIYIDLGADEINLEVAREVSMILIQGNLISTKPKIFVHIKQPNLERAISDLRGANFDMRTFSLGGTASRLLLGIHPPVRTRNSTQPPVHIMLAAYGWMGDALLREIIKTCHYQDLRPVYITVVHEEAERIQTAIEQEYPFLSVDAATDPGYKKISPVAVMHYIKARPERLTINQMKCLCQPKDDQCKELSEVPVDIAYVISDDEVQNRAIAERLAQLREFLKRESDFSQRQFKIVLCANRSSYKGCPDVEWNLFDITDEVIKRIDEMNPYPGAELDAIGKRIHFGYQKQEEQIKGIDACWESAQPFEHSSSNASADHLWVKIWAYSEALNTKDLGRAYDWEYWRAIPLVELLVKHIEQGDRSLLNSIGEMEHRRFCAERLIEGWLYALGKKNADLRLNPTLRPFNDKEMEGFRQGTNDSFKQAAKALQQWCCGQNTKAE